MCNMVKDDFWYERSMCQTNPMFASLDGLDKAVAKCLMTGANHTGEKTGQKLVKINQFWYSNIGI